MRVENSEARVVSSLSCLPELFQIETILIRHESYLNIGCQRKKIQNYGLELTLQSWYVSQKNTKGIGFFTT